MVDSKVEFIEQQYKAPEERAGPRGLPLEFLSLGVFNRMREGCFNLINLPFVTQSGFCSQAHLPIRWWFTWERMEGSFQGGVSKP